jgi:hypothetical protein
MSIASPLVSELDLEPASQFERRVEAVAHIRHAVIAAALLVAQDAHPVTADHLRRAARCEYRAMGHVLGRDHRGGL